MVRSSNQLAKLNWKFDAIPRAIREAVAPALDKSADQLVAAAQHLAPEQSGDLKDSIRKEAGEHDLQRRILAGDNVAFYAVHVEHGTAEAAAKPFFYPAYRLQKKSIQSRIKRAISKAVKEKWAK
ncbi:HK97-gp10 family putative phage morphogenesis protein [Jiella marina]|uniref:HK97-gp10 family putative phage morphogenesis protein n=1 Tax=Jiella sp. LLJ827 TaxID=2917712 RepID=UPI0021018B5B|nr:HK97 gp10 family phage protein [Jiella sp. LLJ827]